MDGVGAAVLSLLRRPAAGAEFLKAEGNVAWYRATLADGHSVLVLMGPANHVDKREIIYGNRDNAPKPESDDLD